MWRLLLIFYGGAHQQGIFFGVFDKKKKIKKFKGGD
jgi:hypothetical protein